MKRFKEKTVIVTGAGSDIGRTTAIRFGQEGANVVLVGLNAKSLEETARAFPQDRTWIHTDNYLIVTCDMSVQSQVEEMIKLVINKFSKLDVLVNCANEGLSNSLTERSVEEKDAIIQTKTEQAVYLCQLAMPYLTVSKGNIVNISPFPENDDQWNIKAYHAVKEDVSALTRKLALDYSAKGVRVNAVNPNINVKIDSTDHHNNAADNTSTLKHCLGGRFATPSDVAAAITFLASNDAAMITGVNLPVDGGVSTSQYHYE